MENHTLFNEGRIKSTVELEKFAKLEEKRAAKARAAPEGRRHRQRDPHPYHQREFEPLGVAAIPFHRPEHESQLAGEPRGHEDQQAERRPKR